MAAQASSRPILQHIITAGPRQSRLVSSPLVSSPLGRTAPLTPSPTTKTRRPFLQLKLSLNTVCSSSRPVQLVDIPPTPRAPVSAIFTALPDIPCSPISAALSESEPEEPWSACTPAATEEAAYRTRHLRIDPQSIRTEGEHPHSWGSFGEVWRGTIVGKTGELERVAVKKIHLRSGDDQSNGRLLRHLLREVVPWYELDHPNITPFIGYIFDGRSARMVSKWQEGGNLNAKEIKKSLRRDPVGALRFAHQVANGLAHLHSRNPPIVHGDMKPENVLIGADGVARLVDFGLSMILDDTLSPGLRTSNGCRHTLLYADPVLLDDVPRTTHTDVWALGWIIYELVTSRKPYYPRTTANAIFKAVITYDVPTRDTHVIPYPDLLWPVLEACWSEDFSRRWSAEKISSHLLKAL